MDKPDSWSGGGGRIEGIGRILRTLSLLAFLAPLSATGAEYALPEDGTGLVGTISYATVQEGETLLDIARAHEVGYRAIRLANPTLDPWIPKPGSRVLLPTSYILPDAPRKGVVLNLAEMRLYYYPPSAEGPPERVITYPVSIGRRSWQTPEGMTEVISKEEKPTWIPPESIRKEAEEEGEPLPPRVPPGPDNPLGDYALRLGIPGYLIHGTNKPFGIGMRVSHGCVRLYPENIAELYRKVDPSTPVRIVDQAYKAALIGDQVFLEAHIPPLGQGSIWHGWEGEPEEKKEERGKIKREGRNYTPLISTLIRITRGRPDLRVDHTRALQAAQGTRGIPVPVPLLGPPSGEGDTVAEEKKPPAEGKTGGGKAEGAPSTSASTS